MRRRYVRSVQQEEQQSLLLMAAGAIVGAAAGLYLGRRYRTLDAFLEDAREKIADFREVWAESDEIEDEDEVERFARGADVDEFDDIEEDDLEPDDLTDDEEDEDFDAELASVGRENGSTESARTAEARARALESRVLDAFRSERVLGNRAIEIAVVGEGVVELTGTVRSLDEVPRAAAVARRVPGVSMVLNRVDVGTGGHIDTASVARDAGVPTEPAAPGAPAS